MVVEEEHRSDWGSVIKSQEQGSPVFGCSPVLDCYAVLTTDNELPGGFDLGNGVWENEAVPVEESPVIGSEEDPIGSPVRSFQLLYSSQSSEEGIKGMKMIPYISSLKETGVIQFEDTSSEEDRRCFNLIYESLLLEGKAGNLTDLAVGMVLAEKPPV